jgi:hypothetical protein
MKKAKLKKPKDTPAAQHARFVEAAKQAEADESPGALDSAFRNLNVTAASRKSIADQSMHRKSKRS